jgi:asparagine synthase (glutamine-hydrolysing)
MCGILVTVGGSRAFTHRDLNPLRRRGPDGIGFWTDGVVSMAQTRLSILGMDDRSQPPLENASHVLVFNGEIYNFLDIARKITGLPAPSDTQVLLDAWTVMGPKVLTMLEGFWAFAIYEKASKRLTLCRDQFGIKPLYYTGHPATGEPFVASSTIEPLLACLPSRPELDHGAMSEWAKYQMPFGARTFHHGLLRLWPGQTLVWDVGERRGVERKAYEKIWEIRGDKLPTEKWVEDARALLIRCVDDAATSDTPVTSTCSGGLDSSLVTRILVPEVAYHANFTDPSCNETQWAKAAVEGIDTRLMVVNAREEFDLVERLESIVKDFDDLAIGSVILPLDDLYEAVARRFKVVLLGTGGDELFGGYARYEMALGTCPQESYRAAFDKLEPFSPQSTPWTRFQALHVKGAPGLFKFFEEPEFPVEEKVGTDRHAMLTFDRKYFLGGLLGIDDKMSGRHGIEARPPLLHQKFVRKVLELDQDALSGKGLLRDIARGILPQPVVDRSDKMGFTTPIGTFVNRSSSRIREVISSSPFRDLYNVRRLSLTAETKWSREVFGLALLDAWLRRYA